MFHNVLRPLLLLIVFSASVLAQSPDSVAFRRAQHLRHGINASEWFAQSTDYSAARLKTYTTLEDIDLMKRMGFDHVRISIDPAVFECLGAKKCESVQVLDAVVDRALEKDLAVVIDLHPSGEWKRQLVEDNNAVLLSGELWTRIAAHYADRDPEKTFFEVLNEPEFKDPYRWTGVQQELLHAVRSRAPKHTIIVAGANWSAIPELLLTGIVPDDNLIYNFHYYEPHIFTHQGATWGDFYWRELRKLPYPATEAKVQPVLPSVQSDYGRWRVMQYGYEHWGHERLNTEIAFAADWAKRHHVPLICNEFGVYRAYSEPKDRAAWIRDARTAFEQNGIGWTIWDYRGGFGVVTKSDGNTTPDPFIVDALGLKPR
jgi:endoglucanase